MNERWHFHWQNLNEKRGGRLGSPLRHGRAWLRIFGGTLNWSWHLLGPFCGASVSATQADDLGFKLHAAVPGVAVWLTVSEFGPIKSATRWLLRDARYEDRELSIGVHDWTVFWRVWRDPMSWSSNVPRWRQGGFRILDALLGRQRHSEREISRTAVKIALPEAQYDATVRLYESTWKRPRWFALHRLGSEVEIAKGIPVPGKGENSWDCDGDALFSQSGPHSTVEAAIASVIESVLRSRRRHGGSVEWQPEQPATAT